MPFCVLFWSTFFCCQEWNCIKSDRTSRPRSKSEIPVWVNWQLYRMLCMGGRSVKNQVWLLWQKKTFYEMSVVFLLDHFIFNIFNLKLTPSFIYTSAWKWLLWMGKKFREFDDQTKTFVSPENHYQNSPNFAHKTFVHFSQEMAYLCCAFSASNHRSTKWLFAV